MPSQKIQQILTNLPKSPGVYQYFNKNNEIIYVGKSVNLKARVNSYFNGKAKLNFAKKKMVEQIEDIKIIVVNNETESLILETNLIKTHSPKYNILMKDDKNHLYIKITKETFPKIIKTRIPPKHHKSDGTYFGPYLNGNYVNFILRFIKKYFGYGVGKHNFFLSKNSYNLDKYLFKGNISTYDTKKYYNEKIEHIKSFIRGDYKKVLPELETMMKSHAAKLEFEQAGKIKETIEAIKSLEINQLARDSIKGNYDIVHYLEKYEKFYIGYIKIRENKIVGMQNFEIKNELEEEKDIILTSFIEQNILGKHLEGEEHGKKLHILLPEDGDFSFPDIVSIEIPKIGAKKELLDLCYKNIYEFAYKKYIASLSVKGFTKNTMLELLEILGYKQINKNIIFECNDISHLSGNFTVASRSIIENGKKNPKKYRKYKIKTLEEQKIDDFGSMREVMTRRLKEIKETKELPDLIVIDGGKGQLGSVYRILKEFIFEEEKDCKNLKDGYNIFREIQIVSIAKREEELFTVESDESFKKIILSKDSEILKMIQKIRDEAHRFAITFNRDSRIKAMKKNILEALPGFGPKTRKKLLKEYGNVENLKNIPPEELTKILNKNQIETLEIHGII